MAGAGCIDLARFEEAPYILEVRAYGIVVGSPQLNSPDVVNSGGMLPTELGTSICEDGQTRVGLSDAVFHTGPVKRALVEPCSKFTPPFDGPVSLADAVIITDYVLRGPSAACN